MSPTDTDVRDQAEQHLRALVGRDDARLREDQWTAIEALAVDRRRSLVVQRTGWGKSAVYFVATLLLREQGAGPTVIVSPLLALMRNQIAAAERAGIRAVTINSTNIESWEPIHDAIRAGEVDVLLVSPERLNNPGFRDEVLPRLAATCGLLVVDEAHCISDWGHDFRPDYRRIRTLLGDLPDGIPVLATTATANARVTADVAEQLGTDVLVLRGSLDRESLRLGVVRLKTAAAAAGLAGRPPRRAARLRHRLLPDRRGHPGDRRLPALPRPRRRGVLRPDRPHRAARARGGPRRAAGSRRWSPPARSAWASTRRSGFVVNMGAPAVAGRLLPAGRPRRPRHRRGHGRAAAGDRGPRHLGLLRLPRLPARGAGPPDPRGAGRRGPAAEHGRAGDVRRAQPHPARDDAQGARRRRRRPPGARRLGGDRPAVGLRRGALRAGSPRPASASSRRCSTTSTTDRCRMRFLRDQLDDPEAADCGRCDNCGGLALSARRLRGGASTRPAPGWPGPGVVVEPRKMWPTGAGQPRRRPQGQDRRGRRGGPRRRPAHRPRPRPGAARPVPAGHPRRPGAGAAGAGRGRGARRLAARGRRRSSWSSPPPGPP